MPENGPYTSNALERFEAKLDSMGASVAALTLELAVVKERLFAINMVELNRKNMFKVGLTVVGIGLAAMTLILNIVGLI